jgi:hypothetical protein
MKAGSLEAFDVVQKQAYETGTVDERRVGGGICYLSCAVSAKPVVVTHEGVNLPALTALTLHLTSTHSMYNAKHLYTVLLLNSSQRQQNMLMITVCNCCFMMTPCCYEP